MSDYKIQHVAGIHDSSTGALVGFLGADGKEYLIQVSAPFSPTPLISTGNFTTVNTQNLAVTGQITGNIYSNNHDKPIVVIGGDHPYSQWFGTSGRGMAQMYFDRGINPYVAICWDGPGLNGGDTTSGKGASFYEVAYPSGGGATSDLMTIAQGLTLQSRGVEFVGHGSRHPDYWDIINTGIRIQYLGAAAAPTVQTTTTGVTLVGNGGAENTTLLYATYTTISTLAAAINAVAGGSKWACYPATELTGDEPSALLLPIIAARNVAATADTTHSVQRFALSGGIYVQYTGTTYDAIQIQYGTTDTRIRLFADGVIIKDMNTANASFDTFNEMVAAINALGVSGLTARLMDNDYVNQGVASAKFRETYMWGDELTSSLRKNEARMVNLRGVYLEAGLGIDYTIRRMMEYPKTQAALSGFTLNNWAQAGANFNHWLHQGALDLYGSFRNGSTTTNSDQPLAQPCFMLTEQTQFTTRDVNCTRAENLALLEALVDSGPFYVDVLCHKLLPDGSSGYELPFLDTTLPAYYDQVESDWVAFLDALKVKKDAGLIEVLTPAQARVARQMRPPPKNLVFNPKFKNSGVDLLTVTNATTGANGRAIPGWRLTAGSTNFSAVSVSNGEITLTTNGALSGTIYPLQQWLSLQRGKTYDIGALIDTRGIPAASFVHVMVFAVFGRVAEDTRISPSNAVYSENIYGGTVRNGRLTFSVPGGRSLRRGKVVSIAGTYDCSTNKLLTVNWDGIGNVTDIDVSGATPAATTANEVAAKINAAVAATAAYVSRPEYHNICTAVDNRVVITGPFNHVQPTAQYLQVTNGSSGTAVATIFNSGANECRGIGSSHDAMQSSFLGYRMEIEFPVGLNGTVKIKSPYCKPVEL